MPRAKVAVSNQRGLSPTFGGTDLAIETFLLAPLEGETPHQIRVEFFAPPARREKVRQPAGF